MQAKTSIRLLRRLALAALITLIAGCGMQALQPGPTSRAQADSLYDSGHYADAAQAYQRLAGAAQGAQRGQLLLRAGDAWNRAGQPERALAALDAIPPGTLSVDTATRAALLRAGIAVNAQRPRAAQQALDQLNIDQLPPATRIDALKLRGETLFALGDAAGAVKALTARGRLLQQPQAVAGNQELLWHGLSRMREPFTAAKPAQPLDPVTAGWLALGEIGRTAWQQPYRFDARINAWRKQYPNHPANGPLLDRLIAAHAKRIAYPDRVAVLLPLTGRYAAVGGAIRDGLLAARYDQNGAGAPLIRIYDTGDDSATALDSYRKAVADGAKAVIGPLDPIALDALLSASAISVPTLTLTNLPEAAAAPPLLYQFGFDPNDEARQAAERAVQDGHVRGVALAPDTPQGHSMVAAFAARLAALGGTVLKTEFYRPGQSNYTTPIKQMLNLDLSDARTSTLKSVLGRNVTVEPRRRRDARFVFLVADNGTARLIRPQIRFNQGIGLPVYSTSAVYEPDSNPDLDLNGVLFTQMPWTLSRDPGIEAIRKRLKQLWPDSFDSAGRYYALGFDAYRLIPLIVHLDQPLTEPVHGVTGTLTIAPDHRIHRQLDWAVYRGGFARAAQPAAGPATQ